MSTRPSFQFYPDDWISNPNLRRCTFAEKGIWLEVMCILHDQDEYGVLRWPLKEIAETVKCRTSELQGLIRKGVLKGDDKALAEPFIYTPRSGRRDGPPVTLLQPQAGPIWYSSRMVKDEYVRTIRAEMSGNGGASKASPKAAPNPPFGEGIGGGFGPRSADTPAAPSSSSPSSSSPSEYTHTESSPAELVRVGSLAGQVCMAMKGRGISDVNPGNPDLLMLIEAGAALEEFEGAATLAVSKGKGYAYAIGIVKRARTEAAKTAQQVHHGAMPAAPASAAAVMLGAHRQAQARPVNDPNTIDME